MPVRFIFRKMFLSINEINLLNSKKARKFCLLGAAWVLGWAHSQVSISVGVGFGQNKVTNYSLQPSLQICVSVDSGSGCSGAWHSTRTAFRQLQHREPGLLCKNLGKPTFCFSAAMCVPLQRTPEWFYPCSVKTDLQGYWLQKEIVTHPGSASLVLPELSYFSELL